MEAMAKLAAVGVTAVVLSAVLKKNTPELALLLALAAGLWMLAQAAAGLGAAVAMMRELAGQADVSEVLLEPVVKAVALSILTKLTAELCKSAGEGAWPPLWRRRGPPWPCWPPCPWSGRWPS